MASETAAVAHFSPWSWDVDNDVLWCLPGLFAMHGQEWPQDSVDETTAIPVPRERWLSLLSSGQRSRVSEFCEAILETGLGGEITYPIAGDDTIRWMMLGAAVGERVEGRVRRVLGYAQDVTAEKLLELRHDRTQRELDQQQRVLERVAAGEPLDGTLELLCRHVERLYPGAFCAIMLCDPAAAVLRSGVSPSLSRDFRDAIDELTIRDGNGACGTAAATGRVAVIQDVRSDSRAASALELLDSYGLRSTWSYPMRSVTGTVLGTVALYRTEPFTPPEDEVRAVAVIGQLAALAIERDGIHTAIQLSANVHPATGLLDRTRFQELVESRLADPLRRTAVLFVEVDRLKYLTDDLGQSGGASLLAEVARRLRAAVGADGVIGRFSGDEFVLGVDCTSAAHLEELMARVHAAFVAPIATREHELFLVATVGATQAEWGSDAAGLTRDAAAAMHAACDERRGGHRIYSRALRTEADDQIGLESELRRAIDFGELILHYQPILDVVNQRFSRIEALVRWNHPARGLLPPAEFIPLAERCGLIVPLGRLVLELAARQGAKWLAGVPGLRIAINVSVLELDEPGYVDQLLGLLQQAGLPVQNLNLEIAESGLIQKLDAARPVLARLQEHGVQAVVDDFGAGYSSLARLGELPITSIKIDRNFIAGIAADATTLTVVRSIIAIARAHKLSVVAEGVEDLTTLGLVEELGCDFAQGFQLAVPSPPDSAAALLLRRAVPRSLQLVTEPE